MADVSLTKLYRFQQDKLVCEFKRNTIMAGPGGKYIIQDQLHTPHPHHASFRALWETKWKQPVSSRGSLCRRQYRLIE